MTVALLLSGCAHLEGPAETALPGRYGDVTHLQTYEVVADDVEAFEQSLREAAARTLEAEGGMWMLYREPTNNAQNQRYFTVSFPDDVDELTEPWSPTGGLNAAVGSRRVEAELWRQVPSWCSTVRMDPFVQVHAHVENLWLRSGGMAAVGNLLEERGALLRRVLGEASEGHTATEAFVAMSAPSQIKLVLFSTVPDRRVAIRQLEASLAASERLEAWRELESQLADWVERRRLRSGEFVLELSAERP